MKVKVFDVKTLELGYTVETGHDTNFRIWSLAFSPNGQSIITASGDRTITLICVTKKTVMRKVLTKHEDQIKSVAFSPDGDFIASGSWDRKVQLLSPAPMLREQPNPTSACQMFDDELLSVGRNDSKWPSFASTIKTFPEMVVEFPSDGTDALVQHAVKWERADFLRTFLLDTNGGANSPNPDPCVLRRNAGAILAAGAVVASNAKPEKQAANFVQAGCCVGAKQAHQAESTETERTSCFDIAIKNSSWVCMNVLLDIVEAGFTSEAVRAPNAGSQRGAHVTDLLSHDTLTMAFKKFPELAAPFILKIKAVPAYPFVVKGCIKFELNGEVKISESRPPSRPTTL